MTITLLLDMDDTLLSNDMDSFLPAYLNKLSAHLQNYVAPEKMLQSLMAGTHAMVRKNLPHLSLEKTFDNVFYPAVGYSKEQIQSHLWDFYRNVYPSLKSVTRVRPQAVAFIEWAFAQGYSIAIATNPLFPRTAIEQRLEWANLPSSQYPFSLITSYEKLHFSKPNPAFFAEVIAQIGWPEHPVVMVGNSLTEDIEPARTIGIPAFQLSEEPSENGIGAGDFSQLKNWIITLHNSQTIVPQTSTALIALLGSTPAALETIAQNLELGKWNQRFQSGEWSLGEIICHLRDVDIEVTIPRVERILEIDTPFITAESTDIWAEERNYLNQDPLDALQSFISARTQLLLRLHQLAEVDWARPARHAIFGPTTLAEILKFTFSHDQDHIRQVAKTLSSSV